VTRRRDASRRPQTTAFPDDFDLVPDPRARSPQAALEASEVYAAIASLPDDFRDVVVAVDVAGLSYGEAARALKVPEGTIMSRLYRARQQVVRRVDGDPK
jgi:RNA polymerase sigma-70 factor (ECF subfamily)